MLFQWTALHPGHFRLLKRRKPLPDRELSYELHSFSIGAAPPYAAVSYTRTSESNDQPVLVNGRTMTIDKQALAALVQVERHAAFEYLWIECLCVNRKDLDEKVSQERAVARIYEHAACVLVCSESGLPEDVPALREDATVVWLESPL